MNTQVKFKETATSYFESKEHYLAFRHAWKTYINEGKHERRLHRFTNWGGNECILKLPSELTVFHHFLYNALRGRDFKKSFSPLVREDRLNNGMDNRPYRAFYVCLEKLRQYAENLESGSGWVQQRYLKELNDLNKVFGGNLTKDMILSLHQNLCDADITLE